MSNEQDNKPERTAMQELIEYVEAQQERHMGFDANGIWRQCQRIIDKAIELRDTVEKEQISNDRMDVVEAIVSEHNLMRGVLIGISKGNWPDNISPFSWAAETIKQLSDGK